VKPDVVNIGGSLTHMLVVEDESQVGHARRVVQQLAEETGFDAADAGRAALVATELTSNLLKHAGHGALHLRMVPGRGGVRGIEILAIDRGPGFNLADCLADGYSTGASNGIGMGAVARQAQVFDVYADAGGAVMLARLYPRGTPDTTDLRFGATQFSLHDDPACGDAWELAFDGQRIAALLLDGLGHGPDAARAARAGTEAFARNPFAAPAVTMADMHQAMSGTRGGAGGMAQYDGHSSTLRFVGIGNIAARIVAAGASRGLASHPGIIGVQFRKAHTFEYAQTGGQLLIMHSDGLQSRWRMEDYPGLWQRHPAVITALLHRDFCRGNDDVTVLAVALEVLHA